VNNVDRAKQFAPFEALKGLREALWLTEKEHEKKKKIELSEFSECCVQRELEKLKKGDLVKVKWYFDGSYSTLTGKVDKIDKDLRFLLFGDEKIIFDDIYSIESL